MVLLLRYSGNIFFTEWGIEFLEKIDEALVEAGYGFQYVHKPFDEPEQTNNITD